VEQAESYLMQSFDWFDFIPFKRKRVPVFDLIIMGLSTRVAFGLCLLALLLLRAALLLLAVALLLSFSFVYRMSETESCRNKKPTVTMQASPTLTTDTEED
jgi:hypothetical protein